MKASSFAASDVHKIATLAHIPLTDDEAIALASGFRKVLQVVDELNVIDVSNVEPTHQVTGLENVFREDVIDTTRMFTQEQALKNAKRVSDGFIVVDQILEK